MSTKLTKLLQSGRQVFNLDDLGIIWGQKKRSDTRQSARDYAAQGSLKRLKPGVYALPHVDLDTYAIANKILAPSYVTGLSILTDAGLSYQYTDKVFSIALYNKSYEVDGSNFIYSQAKPSVLFNSLGLDEKAKFSIASTERAIADLIYLSKGQYPFEKVEGIDWDLLESCGEIYDCAFVLREIGRLRELYA